MQPVRVLENVNIRSNARPRGAPGEHVPLSSSDLAISHHQAHQSRYLSKIVIVAIVILAHPTRVSPSVLPKVGRRLGRFAAEAGQGTAATEYFWERRQVQLPASFVMPWQLPANPTCLSI